MTLWQKKLLQEYSLSITFFVSVDTTTRQWKVKWLRKKAFSQLCMSPENPLSWDFLVTPRLYITPNKQQEEPSSRSDLSFPRLFFLLIPILFSAAQQNFHGLCFWDSYVES